jgi:hypothetical protein
MKKLWNIIEVGFGVVALLLVCAFLSIAWSRVADAAAWVQAVGSIAAIAGAFAIARNQAKETDRQREQDRLDIEADFCRTALLISIEAVKCVGSINHKLDPARSTAIHIGTERLEEVLHALRGLASKNLTYPIHNQVLVMQCELAYTLTAARQFNAGALRTLERHQKAGVRIKKIAAASCELHNLARTNYHLLEVTLPTAATRS